MLRTSASGDLGFGKPKAMNTAEFRAVLAAAWDELIRRLAAIAHADRPLDLRSRETTRKLLEGPSPLDNAYEYQRTGGKTRELRGDLSFEDRNGPSR